VARTAASLSAAARVTDYISLGVITADAKCHLNADEECQLNARGRMSLLTGSRAPFPRYVPQPLIGRRLCSGARSG
jgi:hypothetical protein